VNESYLSTFKESTYFIAVTHNVLTFLTNICPYGQKKNKIQELIIAEVKAVTETTKSIRFMPGYQIFVSSISNVFRFS